MGKIKVIHYVETLDKGGLENVIYNLTTRLDRKLFDVHVVCRISGGYTAERLKNLNIPLKIFNENKIPVWNLKNTLKGINHHSPTILHCHGLFATSSEAIIGRLADFDSVFVHVHNLERPDSVYQRFKLAILKRSISNFIAVSEEVKNSLASSFIYNVEVIQNAIDTKKFKYLEETYKGKLGFSNNAFLIGMVGRIVKRKGYDYFVELIENTSNVVGVIIGEGPYRECLESLVLQKKLQNRIKFLPFQSQDRLPHFYSMLDAFFLFSEKEGLPLAILEAQSVGVPYIGNSIGGIGEVIEDGYNGFIHDKFNLYNIKKSISSLIESPNYFRDNARKAVKENFSIDTAIKSIEKLYLSSLS